MGDSFPRESPNNGHKITSVECSSSSLDMAQPRVRIILFIFGALKIVADKTKTVRKRAVMKPQPIKQQHFKQLRGIGHAKMT